MWQTLDMFLKTWLESTPGIWDIPVKYDNIVLLAQNWYISASRSQKWKDQFVESPLPVGVAPQMGKN